MGYHDIITEVELSGAVSIPDKPVFSTNKIRSGEFQSQVEDYFEDRLFFRRTLTRVYNQLLYSVFGSTSNTDMLVGVDNYIFEKPYATAYLTEIDSNKKSYIQQGIHNLEKLCIELKKRNVTLIARMSPSKAEFYPEYLPMGYDRYTSMKQNGEYTDNWNQYFIKEIANTCVPFYNQHDLMQQMKNDGSIVFAKGGTHWTLVPMLSYINGLNELIEKHTNKKLGRMNSVSEAVLVGKMGTADDSDIWQICWNAVSVKPNYPSPNIQYDTVGISDPLRVLNVGQSFSTLLLSTIFGVEQPLWDEAYFSWYNSRVIQYSKEYPKGNQISDKTDDFDEYMKMDVIIVEFLENGEGYIQFQFVESFLLYLQAKEV